MSVVCTSFTDDCAKQLLCLQTSVFRSGSVTSGLALILKLYVCLPIFMRKRNENWQRRQVEIYKQLLKINLFIILNAFMYYCCNARVIFVSFIFNTVIFPVLLLSNATLFFLLSSSHLLVCTSLLSSVCLYLCLYPCLSHCLVCDIISDIVYLIFIYI
jgi:hypothetical protein